MNKQRDLCFFLFAHFAFSLTGLQDVDVLRAFSVVQEQAQGSTKLKSRENEKHPLDELKNDEITKKREK